MRKGRQHQAWSNGETGESADNNVLLLALLLHRDLEPVLNGSSALPKLGRRRRIKRERKVKLEVSLYK
jgi:hypothetical protein